MSYHHKAIKRFSLGGVINDDSQFERLKGQYIALLTESMRMDGYSPRLDIHEDFTLHYNGNCYEFELSVYGSYVGKKKAAEIHGLDRYNPIPFPSKATV